MSDKRRILIIEDDPDIRLGWSLYLGRRFDVAVAEDSITGLVAARRFRPEAIVLDLGLPGGDGLQLLERMRQLPDLAHTPVLVCSGRDVKTMTAQAKAAGAQRVFSKPVLLDSLEQALTELLAKPVVPTRTALVVDDDPDTRAALSVRLRSMDLVVTEAADGASAVMQARRNPPDVVLLDLGLPCGDGYSVLQRMRDLDSMQNVPILVISGQEGHDVERRVLRAGADAFLQKPTDGRELSDNLQAVL